MTVNYDKLPLDTSQYYIHPDLVGMYKSSTGIQDDKQLKKHVIEIQKEAYEIYPYPCIGLLTFTKMSITELHLYDQVIQLGKQRRGAILLEIGPGFGSDIRKMIYDGFPAEDMVACDLTPDLWEFGHRLFCSNPAEFPVKFLQGDIFDETTLSTTMGGISGRPDLVSLNTLTNLKGHVSVLILQRVFHLFSDEMQAALARRLAHLLSPAPGSIIMGKQMGTPSPKSTVINDRVHFSHSPESWEQMWSTIFAEGEVEYVSELTDLPEAIMIGTVKVADVSQFLSWSIRRL